MNFNCIANPDYVPKITQFMRENSAKLLNRTEKAVDGGKEITRTFVNKAGQELAYSTTKITQNGDRRIVNTTFETVNGMSKKIKHDMNLFNAYFYRDNGKTILPYQASTTTTILNKNGLVAQESVRNYKLHTEAFEKARKKDGMQSFVLKDVSENDLSAIKETDILEFLHFSEQGVPLKGYSRKATSRMVLQDKAGKNKTMWTEEDFGPVKEIGMRPAKMTPLDEGINIGGVSLN